MYLSAFLYVHVVALSFRSLQRMASSPRPYTSSPLSFQERFHFTPSFSLSLSDEVLEYHNFVALGAVLLQTHAKCCRDSLVEL